MLLFPKILDPYIFKYLKIIEDTPIYPCHLCGRLWFKYQFIRASTAHLCINSVPFPLEVETKQKMLPLICKMCLPLIHADQISSVLQIREHVVGCQLLSFVDVLK